MRKKLFGIILIIIISSVFMTGCTSTVHKKSNPNTTPKISDNNSTVPDKDYKKVFGDINVEKFRTQLKDGKRWIPFAISDNGEIFGFTAAVHGNLSQIMEYDLNTHKENMLCTIQDKYQPDFFEFNENYLLWIEYLPPYDDGGRKVVLYNRKSHETKTLNTRPSYKGMADDRIALGKNYALWSTGTIENNKQVFKIYKYTFDTGKTEVFKENAVMPVIGDNFIAWLGPKDNVSNNSVLYVQNLKNNSVKNIAEDINPMYITAYKDKIVYSGTIGSSPSNPRDMKENVLVLYQNGKQTVIEKSKRHDYEFPTVCDKFVTWDENFKKRIYCINSKTIAVLPSLYGEPHICNNYILWGDDVDEPKEKAVNEGMYLTDESAINVSKYVK